MNLKKIICIASLLLLLSLSLFAQTSKNSYYKAGEKLTYEGSFSKLLLRGIDVADMSFTVYNSPDKENFYVQAEARSKGTLSKLFNFSFYQKIDSTVDGDSFSVLKTIKRDEQGERVRDSEAVFDYRTDKVTYVETDPNDPQRPPRRVASSIKDETQDLISAIYSLRNMPFAVGKTFTIAVSDSGMVYQVPVKVTGREKQKSVLGKTMCWKVEPEVFGDNRMIEQKGSMTIWITDDTRRIPVRSKIDTKLGKIEIKLRKVERAK